MEGQPICAASINFGRLVNNTTLVGISHDALYRGKLPPDLVVPGNPHKHAGPYFALPHNRFEGQPGNYLAFRPGDRTLSDSHALQVRRYFRDPDEAVKKGGIEVLEWRDSSGLIEHFHISLLPRIHGAFEDNYNRLADKLKDDDPDELRTEINDGLRDLKPICTICPDIGLLSEGTNSPQFILIPGMPKPIVIDTAGNRKPMVDTEGRYSPRLDYSSQLAEEPYEWEHSFLDIDPDDPEYPDQVLGRVLHGTVLMTKNFEELRADLWRLVRRGLYSESRVREHIDPYIRLAVTD